VGRNRVREDQGDRERQQEGKNGFHDKAGIDNSESEAEALFKGQLAGGKGPDQRDAINHTRIAARMIVCSCDPLLSRAKRIYHQHKKCWEMQLMQ